MANPILKVILTAVDEVSGVAKKAGDGVVSFGDRAKGALAALGALGVGAALGAFFKSTIEEAANAEREITRLNVALRNAGADVSAVAPKAQALTDRLALLAGVSGGDVMEALTGLVTVSGDVDGSMENMSLVMDLAAARGIDLGSAADIVGKAMNGNVTAFNKLGIAGKDATTVLDNARSAFGGFAEAQGATLYGTLGRINEGWDQFKEKVGVAIVSGADMGEMGAGLAGVLANLGTWVEENEAAIGLFTSALGNAVGAIVDVASSIWETAGPAIELLAKVVGATLIGALNSAAFAVRGLASAYKFMAGATLEALGYLVEKGGKLLKVFGVQVVSEAGTSIREFGEKLRTSAKDDMAAATATYAQGMTDLIRGRRESNEKIEAEVKTGGVRINAAAAAANKARLDQEAQAARERERLEVEANRLILKAAEALQQGLAKTGGSWVDLKRKVDEANSSVLKIVGSTEDLEEAAKQAADENARLSREAEEARQHFEDNVDSAASLGQSLLSAANGMGLIDDKASQALTSVLNMGAAIAKFGIGSPEGLLSIVGGLAQLIGGWGSSAAERARQEAHMKNTRAIEELRRDLSEYNGAVSGSTFSGVIAGLEEASFTDSKGRQQVDAEYLSFALAGAGVSLADAKKLADRYGIDVEKDPGGWVKLLNVLRERKFGSAQGNFADELSSLTDSFDVLGVDDADDQLDAFRKFAEKNIPILGSALEGDVTTEAGRNAIVGKLRDLYARAVSGQLLPGDYGKATPSQFRSLIGTLLPLLGETDGLLGSGLSSGVGLGGGPIGGPPPTGGTVGLAASTGAGLLGAPGLPSPNIADAFAGLGGGSSTTINGLTINLPIMMPEGEDSETFSARVADAVDRLLVNRYDGITAARGTVAQVGR